MNRFQEHFLAGAQMRALLAFGPRRATAAAIVLWIAAQGWRDAPGPLS